MECLLFQCSCCSRWSSGSSQWNKVVFLFAFHLHSFHSLCWLVTLQVSCFLVALRIFSHHIVHQLLQTPYCEAFRCSGRDDCWTFGEKLHTCLEQTALLHSVLALSSHLRCSGSGIAACFGEQTPKCQLSLQLCVRAAGQWCVAQNQLSGYLPFKQLT